MSADSLRALLAQATPGPWEAGAPWLIAGVRTDLGGDRCAFCSDGGERHGPPAWVGQRSINGDRRLAHVHRDGDPASVWSNNDHYITGPLNDGDPHAVAGNFDYEAGGIVTVEDRDLIVAAVNALPALLDVVDAAKAVVGWDFRESSALDSEQALLDALARLEANA